MTEKAPYHPISKKGRVRAEIAEMLLEEVRQGYLQALIARSADFYGPGATLGIGNVLVLDKLVRGNKAQWMGDINARHSLTYTVDAGKATALLGNTESAYNQQWHLPTDMEVLTGKEFIELSAKLAGAEPKFMLIKKGMLNMMGLFNNTLKEIAEMYYQNQYDYLFDSSKFDKAFDFRKTPYKEGIAQTIKSLR
jgi:nucleoside-diphosphate-sugar epimerase